MTKRFLGVAVALLAAPVALAQFTPSNPYRLTTAPGFDSDNQGSIGGAIYFDFTNLTTSTVDWQTLALNLAAYPGVPVTIDVYVTPGTRVGNETNPGVWSLVGQGGGTTAGIDLPTAITLNAAIPFPPGGFGIALVESTGASGHAYTNGTGGNETAGDGRIRVVAGASANVPFTGGVFAARVPNVTIGYAPTTSPYADFRADRTDIGPGGTIQFAAESFSSDPGDLQILEWDLDGDGSFDVVSGPGQYSAQWTYPTAGVYDVTLLVVDATGSAIANKLDHVVVDGVHADFVVSRPLGFAPHVAQFRDTSSGNPTSWAWDLDGDGSIDSNAQHPQWTYSTPGTHDVTLTATSLVGSDLVTRTRAVVVGDSHDDPGPADVLNYQFNEPRGPVAGNAAVGSPAGHGTWHNYVPLGSGRPEFGGTEPGFGCLGVTGVADDNYVASGWPLALTDMTVMWWHRVSPAGAASTSALGYAWGGTGSNWRCFFGAAAGVGGLYRGSPIGDFNIGANVVDTPDRWLHLALVVDDANGVATWYVDGAVTNSMSFPPGLHAVSNTEVLVGRHQSSATAARWYDMDDFRLYGRPLAAGEVVAAMVTGEVATGTPYATGCPHAGGTPTLAGIGRPTLGNPNYRVRMGNPDPAAFGNAMLLGATCNFGLGLGVPLPFDLGSFGAPGCLLQTDLIIDLPGTDFPLPIQPTPTLVTLDLYVQGFSLSANGVSTSGGFDVNIRAR